jgi:DedD protein
MPEAEDAQLEIKKRARRRLVGAIALSLFAAIIFPLVMDHDPGPIVQDIEIRIPGQDDRTLNNRLALQPPPEEAPDNGQAPVSSTTTPTEQPPQTTPSSLTTPPEPVALPKSAETPAAPAAIVTSTPDKAASATNLTESKRAQDILSAKTNKESANHEKTAGQGQFIILIGAFSNEGNVKVLRKKLDEIGLKSFTEPLGEKTRVRAGPFPNRESAEKALQKMKTISVGGQISTK